MGVDFRKCDLLIIMGTSLMVAPVSRLPNMVRSDCPRKWSWQINSLRKEQFGYNESPSISVDITSALIKLRIQDIPTQCKEGASEFKVWKSSKRLLINRVPAAGCEWKWFNITGGKESSNYRNHILLFGQFSVFGLSLQLEL